MFSIKELIENLFYMEVYPVFLPIRSADDQYLAISLEAIENKDPNYLYRIDNNEGPPALTLNFHLFLNRYVAAQGATFYEWPIYSAAGRYYLEGDE
ncbi:hypothetical protein [Planomicrobium sp. CPCC 101079]|uniref:hypothetical protein n=1 Tax=Planomicrobium sp. CPCC 101079 TaxID=2599618 RepID=UPI0011B413ED|nr:hypothetical protein [Planomicrobium sp. CPCC 101079]TWT14323.1 hypothetical protein FQV28_01605 [Planomicrobium sp. CPCC 101079]